MAAYTSRVLRNHQTSFFALNSRPGRIGRPDEPGLRQPSSHSPGKQIMCSATALAQVDVPAIDFEEDQGAKRISKLAHAPGGLNFQMQAVYTRATFINTFVRDGESDRLEKKQQTVWQLACSLFGYKAARSLQCHWLCRCSSQPTTSKGPEWKAVPHPHFWMPDEHGRFRADGWSARERRLLLYGGCQLCRCSHLQYLFHTRQS